MKSILSFALVLGFSAMVSAQDAASLLNKLSQEAKAYGSIEATYTSTMVDRVSDFEATQAGTIYVEGDKYNLDIGDYVIISDGITIWTYDPAVNDCYIDDAEIMAEEGMDPSKLFTIWEDDFKSEWKGNATVKGQNLVQINLYPLDAESKPFHTIQLYIDEGALQLKRAVVKGREGTDVTYDVGSFKPRATVPANTFTFDPAKYPGVNLVDNRI
ncbi:MAG: LolA family protein [Flavobacteriales bacterium]